MQSRRILVALGVAALLAVATLLSTWDRAEPERAQAASPGPGMFLTAPGTATAGQPFIVTVNGTGLPLDYSLRGFQFELLFDIFPERDDCDNVLDDDGDSFVNDGCPQVGAAPEVGRFCDNITDDDNDGAPNDGCPGVGVAPEITQCVGNQDDDGDGFVNDGCLAVGPPETGAQCSNATNDDFPDDPFVNDGCPAVGDPELNECVNAVNDDPGDDSLVNDGCPVIGVTEVGECENGFDDDFDGAPNDGCPQVGASDEAGSFCDNTKDEDGDTFVNDGCLPASPPELGADCDNATDDDGDGRPNDGCPIRGGLRYTRTTCLEEVVLISQKNGNPASCYSIDTDPFGGAAFGVLASCCPIESLDIPSSSTFPLAELIFTCHKQGSHRLTLTAKGQAGALYFDTFGRSLAVKTIVEGLDLNYDGTPEAHNVADSVLVECSCPAEGCPLAPLGPTPTPTPTPDPVGGVAELPEVAGTPLEAPDSSGSNTGLLAGIVAAIAAALALSVAAWYARRRA